MWCWPCHAPNCDVVAELIESLPLLQRERTSCMQDKVCVDVYQQCASFRSGLLVGLANWMKFCGDTRRQMAFFRRSDLAECATPANCCALGRTLGEHFWGQPNFSASQSKKHWNQSQSAKIPFPACNGGIALMTGSLLDECCESILKIAETQPPVGKMAISMMAEMFRENARDR